jgi:hypothetical protein
MDALPRKRQLVGQCACRRFASLFRAGGESIFGAWCEAKLGRGCVARTILFCPPPRVARGRGTMRSMVEGACGAEINREAEAPSTALTP